MDITILAAWGEFIGGIAVVVSLVYLASQIRQNSKLLRASTASVSHETGAHIPLLTASDPEVMRIYWEGLADRNALSAPDQQRFDMVISVYMSGVQQEHQFAQDGVISPSIWSSRVRSTRWLLQRPGMLAWWAQWGRETHSDEFGDFVDGLIREGEAAG